MKQDSLVDLAVLSRADEQCEKAFADLYRTRRGDRNRICTFCNVNPVGRPYGFQCNECRLLRQRQINERRSNGSRSEEYKKRKRQRKDLLKRYENGEF